MCKVLWASPGRGTDDCGDAKEAEGPAAAGPSD